MLLDLGLRTKTDFAHSTGNSYLFTKELCLSLVLVPIRSLEFGQFKSVNVLEKDRLYKFYQKKSPIQFRDQSTPFCGVSGVLDISIRDRLAKGKIFTSHYGDLHVNGKFFFFTALFPPSLLIQKLRLSSCAERKHLKSFLKLSLCYNPSYCTFKTCNTKTLFQFVDSVYC